MPLTAMPYHSIFSVGFKKTGQGYHNKHPALFFSHLEFAAGHEMQPC